MFDSLFSKYDRLVLFDTETTGLQFARDEIIEFAAVVVERVNGVPKMVQEYDELIALSPATQNRAAHRHHHPGPPGKGPAQDPGCPGCGGNDPGKHPFACLQCPF